MKKLLIIILTVLAVSILGGWLYFSIYLRILCRDIPDRLEAMKIPRYPNANFWRIRDSTNQCFLSAGRPSADIYFYSDRKPAEVLSFFKEELPKRGWSFENTGGSTFDAAGNPVEPYDLWANFVKEDGSDRIRFYLATDYYMPPARVDWNYSIYIRGKHPYYKNKYK